MSAGRYDVHTIELMRTVLDSAWNALTLTQKRAIHRSDMAAFMLEAASQGERDPIKLRKAALSAREFIRNVA